MLAHPFITALITYMVRRVCTDYLHSQLCNYWVDDVLLITFAKLTTNDPPFVFTPGQRINSQIERKHFRFSPNGLKRNVFE